MTVTELTYLHLGPALTLSFGVKYLVGHQLNHLAIVKVDQAIHSIHDKLYQIVNVRDNRPHQWKHALQPSQSTRVALEVSVGPSHVELESNCQWCSLRENGS